MIVRQDDTTIELSNGISIECRPCSFRKLRGLTFVGACCDELAFWYQDSSYANPDVEVVSSIRPGLLTTGGPLLLVSSVYGKSGVLYDNWRKFYGSDDPGTLVAYGTSKDFNPSLPQDEIDAALAEDRPRNAAEYLSEWRADLETFVPREAVNACVARGVFERTPERRITYFGFVDPAGGFGGNSMTLAIGHKSFGGETVVIDCVREQRPPFSPEAVIQEFAAVLKSYRINKIFGDKFAGGFPPEQFRHFGIMFEQSAKAKTDLYCDLLPLINSRRVDLLDNQRLIAQLCSLERRTTRGSGRDVIDHPPNGHDDLSNAVAGCASGCLSDRASQYRRFLKSFSSDDDEFLRSSSVRAHAPASARHAVLASLAPLACTSAGVLSYFSCSKRGPSLTATASCNCTCERQPVTAAAPSRRDRSGCRSEPRVARRRAARCRHGTVRGC